jgi:hypothetical protein
MSSRLGSIATDPESSTGLETSVSLVSVPGPGTEPGSPASWAVSCESKVVLGCRVGLRIGTQSWPEANRLCMFYIQISFSLHIYIQLLELPALCKSIIVYMPCGLGWNGTETPETPLTCVFIYMYIYSNIV